MKQLINKYLKTKEEKIFIGIAALLSIVIIVFIFPFIKIQENDTLGLIYNPSSQVVVLEDISDVDTSGKVNSDVLTYNSSTGNWIASTSSAGTVTDITDLDLNEGLLIVGDPNNKASATSSIYISSDGNVGIGTTTPLDKLVVDDGVDATSTLASGGLGSVGCLKVWDTDGGGYTYCTALNGTLTCSANSCK